MLVSPRHDETGDTMACELGAQPRELFRAGFPGWHFAADMARIHATENSKRHAAQFVIDRVLVLFYTPPLWTKEAWWLLSRKTHPGSPGRSRIDTEAGVVTPDRIFVHRSAKSFVCVGIGAGGALLERAARSFEQS